MAKKNPEELLPCMHCQCLAYTVYTAYTSLYPGDTPILPVPTLEATHVSHFREASQRTTIGGTSGGGVGT